MNIIEKSSNNLVLSARNRSNSFFSYIFGSGVVVIISTAFISIIIAETTRQQILKCTRIEPTQVNCRVQEKTIIQTNEKPPIQLTGAELIEREVSGEDGSYKEYPIELYSKNGKQDFGYTRNENIDNKAELRTIVSQINLFIANHNQRILQLQQSRYKNGDKIGMWSAIISVTIFDIIAILIIINLSFFAPLNVTLKFDKNSHKFTFYKKYYLLRKTKYEYSLLGQISLAIGIDGQIHLILESKEKLEVPNWDISPKDVIKIADEIQLFLNHNKENEKLTLIKSKNETWNFDRSQHKLTIVKILPSGKEESISEYSLLGQVSLEIDNSETDSDGDAIYKLYFISDEKEKLELYSGSSQTAQWRDVITEFLKLNIVKS